MSADERQTSESTRPLKEFTRIVAINPSQNLIWKKQSINIPASLPGSVRGVFEILVIRLQKPKVEAIHRSLRDKVGAEEYPAGVLKKEIPGRIRLAAQFRATRADINV